MSRIEGIEQFRAGLKRFEDEVAAGVSLGIEAEVRAMQLEVADLVPIETGTGRQTILLPEAIKIGPSPDGPERRVVFGFLTRQMQRAAYYLFWVEFGTKVYKAGEQRAAGYDKKGRKRWRKVKRGSPARMARPFWRPAEANLWRRLEARLNMHRLVAAAKRLANFADQS